MTKNTDLPDFFEDAKKNFDDSIFVINTTNLEIGFKYFISSITATNSEITKNDYYYINVWSIVCKPCIDEIPFLNSLPKTFSNKIGYIMISSHSDAAVNNFLKKKGIIMENFIFINKMTDFISGIYNEIEINSQSFPLHVILDKKGNCLAYLFGAIHDENSAAPLINFINTLK